MRTFGRLKGHKYFLLENAPLERRFSRYLDGVELDELATIPLPGHGEASLLKSSVDLRRIFPRAMRLERDLLLVLLDCAADFLEVDRIRTYTYDELCSEIRAKPDEIDSLLDRDFTEGGGSIKASKGVESILRNSIKRRRFDKPPYYYYKLMDYLLRKRAVAILMSRFAGIFPTLRAAITFINIMDEFWPSTDNANR